MELAELTAYAEERYQMREERKWAEFPGFSVLTDARTGRWAALLMRQWDGETGVMIERCDLRCGPVSDPAPWVSGAYRMRGPNWVGVRIDEQTDPESVFRLLDLAMSPAPTPRPLRPAPEQAGAGEKRYGDTPLVFSGRQSRTQAGNAEPRRESLQNRNADLQREISLLIDRGIAVAGSALEAAREAIPEALRQMKRLYEYGRQTPEAQARNFYRQGMRMRDYVDDVPWTGDFVCYYPTYHDLNTRQLRGYFTWRAGVRQGRFTPIPTSAAYLYVYELLNGIGADSPADSLEKLRAFETGYLDSGVGDAGMRTNLRRWMLELAVLRELPRETALRCADPELLQFDADLETLKRPADRDDAAVFAALCRLGGKKTEGSPVVSADPERAARLFAGAWRLAAADWRRDGKTLFTACFGGRRTRRWYPMSNAVYWQAEPPGEREYVLDPCRSFRCRGGLWQVSAYERSAFDKALLQGFLHETDLRLRRALRTGRYLKERPEDDWADPYVDAALSAERKAAAAAARPRVRLDLSGLDRIRSDAISTRDSLLTEEEKAELAAAGPAPERLPPAPTAAPDAEPIKAWTAPVPSEPPAVPASGSFAPFAPPAAGPGALPLDETQTAILLDLLRGADPGPRIARAHLTPSLAADAVNEALFELFGDTVLACEDDTLCLVEDYRADLIQLFEEGGGEAGS